MTAAAAPARLTYSRHPADAVRLVLGLGLLALTALAARSGRVRRTEENVFRLVNDVPLPDWLWPAVWLLMQFGNLGAVPAVAVLAAVTRRWRLAFDMAVAGGLIWLLAKVVKEMVQRGRPAAYLDSVYIYGEPAGGLGYPSGHSAVAVALATVSSPYLGRRGRRAAWLLALAVCVSRMWVGAHLPLDVAAGVALGWLAGVFVHLLLGAPGGQPSTASVRRALARAGLDPMEVRQLGGADARRSAYFVVRRGGGPELFVKVVPRERRDSDLVARAWRRLGGGPGTPEGPPAQQVAHEAAMALLARAAGVRTPAVELVRSVGNGAGLYAYRWVPGRVLAELPVAEVGDDLLVELWRQVAVLHGARIAHGDLGPHSVVVAEDGAPWLVDFSHSEAVADAGRLDRDAARLLDALAALVGPQHATAAARAGLGDEAVDRARSAGRRQAGRWARISSAASAP
ncbi:MAG: phosphatase PAP2 family protein [Mycobacteriales bacterium]